MKVRKTQKKRRRVSWRKRNFSPIEDLLLHQGRGENGRRYYSRDPIKAEGDHPIEKRKYSSWSILGSRKKAKNPTTPQKARFSSCTSVKRSGDGGGKGKTDLRLASPYLFYRGVS